jgi:multiple sugar transport system permease protein
VTRHLSVGTSPLSRSRLDAPPVGTSGGGAPGRRPARPRRFDVLPYLLVSPLAIFIVGLALVPAAFTIIESFYRVNSLDPPTRFTGLGNLRRLWGDHTLHIAAENTLVYVLIGVGLSTVLGIVMAVTLQQKFRGRAALIAILILPWALPGVVEGIV